MQDITENKIKRRAALYARVSTALQGSGLDAQVRALKIYCEQNNIVDYELYRDENQSGTKVSRPGLDRKLSRHGISLLENQG